MRQMLIEFSEEQHLPEVGTVIAEDQMDDGTPIRVCQLPLSYSLACRVILLLNPYFRRYSLQRRTNLKATKSYGKAYKESRRDSLS